MSEHLLGTPKWSAKLGQVAGPVIYDDPTTRIANRSQLEQAGLNPNPLAALRVLFHVNASPTKATEQRRIDGMK